MTTFLHAAAKAGRWDNMRLLAFYGSNPLLQEVSSSPLAADRGTARTQLTNRGSRLRFDLAMKLGLNDRWTFILSCAPTEVAHVLYQQGYHLKIRVCF